MRLIRELIDGWRYDKELGELSVAAQFIFCLLCNAVIMAAALSPMLLDR